MDPLPQESCNMRRKADEKRKEGRGADDVDLIRPTSISKDRGYWEGKTSWKAGVRRWGLNVFNIREKTGSERGMSAGGK